MRRDDISPEPDPRISWAMADAGFSSPAGAIVFAEMLCGLLMWVWSGIAWLLTRKYSAAVVRAGRIINFMTLAVLTDELGSKALSVWGMAIAANVLLTILMILANRWQRRQ